MNSDELKAYNREKTRRWRAAHPGYNAAKSREWRRENKDRYQQLRQAYYLKKRDSHIACVKAYAIKNRDKITARMLLRRKTDPAYRLRSVLTIKLNKFLKGKIKAASTQSLTSCSFEDLKSHLESQFKPGMTWFNYGAGEGKWNLDHIKPLISFDLSTEESQRAAFHFSNLRPLWAIDNCSKGSMWNGIRIRSNCRSSNQTLVLG